MALADDLDRIAGIAGAHAGPADTVSAVLATEPRVGERVYLCAFDDGDGRRSWLAVAADGSPVRTRTALREAVSIVFQESFLFSTTIGENIALDSGADGDAVERAARIAAVDRFVRTLPEGFDTVVGERGHTLSGGERQRVALARAIVREPRALILDDATSSVDPSIEASILSALREELHTTLVVIAYRLSTIRLADRVVFLRDGRLVDQTASAPGPETLLSGGRRS